MAVCGNEATTQQGQKKDPVLLFHQVVGKDCKYGEYDEDGGGYFHGFCINLLMLVQTIGHLPCHLFMSVTAPVAVNGG